MEANKYIYLFIFWFVEMNFFLNKQKKKKSEGFDEKTFFSTLRAYLHDEDSEMKCISIEGFCKWFLLGLTSDLEVPTFFFFN